jgi:hypothetical protein
MVSTLGVILIGILAALLLLLAVVLFFAFWNIPRHKVLYVNNDTGVNIFVIVSSTSPSGETVIESPIRVPTGQRVLTLSLYPGTLVYVQAYLDSAAETDALTTAFRD